MTIETITVQTDLFTVFHSIWSDVDHYNGIHKYGLTLRIVIVSIDNTMDHYK